jgi:hypothetical protein
MVAVSRSWLVAPLVGPLVLAAACNSTTEPPADLGERDGSTVADAGGPRPDGTTGADAMSPGDGGAEGGREGGETGPAPEAEAGEVFAPECLQSSTWSSLARVTSIAPASFDQFGSISANALSVAWTTAAGEVLVADRTSTTGSFGTPAPVAGADAGSALAGDRVALDPTGSELIATLADRSSFTTFVRAGAGQPWASGGADQFKYVSATISESGGAFSQPVLSADGLSLFYVLVIAQNPPVFYESTWDASNKAWNLGNPLPNTDFAIASASQLRRPTGASSDRLTLFFFDEVAGNERAAWRLTPTSPFTFFEDLPNLPEAAPDADCNILYFEGMDAAGEGLFTAQ